MFLKCSFGYICSCGEKLSVFKMLLWWVTFTKSKHSQKPKVWLAVRTPKAKSLRESEKATPVGFHREGKARQPILHAKDATDLQILTKLGQVRRLCLGRQNWEGDLYWWASLVSWEMFGLLCRRRRRLMRSRNLVTLYRRCQDTLSLPSWFYSLAHWRWGDFSGVMPIVSAGYKLPEE